MSDVLRAEVAVIGGGAAGMMAGAAAASAGAAVVLVKGPPGATTLSSGAVDLAGDRFRGAAMSVAESLAQSLEATPSQPLARLGRALTTELAVKVAGKMCSSTGLYPPRGLDRLQALIPTALGHLHPAWLRQAGQADVRTLSGRRLGVVEAPGGQTAAEVICRGLAGRAAAAGFEAEYLPIPLELPGLLDAAQPLLMARRLDGDESAVDHLGRALAEAGREHNVDGLLIPPWAGLERAPEVIRELETAAGVTVRELLGRPGEPSGLRLQRNLEGVARARGVEVLHGKAMEALVRDGRFVGVHVRGGRDEVLVEARSFVLATGGFVGGGFLLEGTLREPLLDLPVELDGRLVGRQASRYGTRRVELFGDHPEGPHPISRAGVVTDDSMRPISRGQGDVIYPNLRVAGAMLADHDPVVQRSGLGTAMITGWFAGDRAAADVFAE